MLAWLFAALNGREQARLKGIPGPTPRFPFGTAGAFLGPWLWEVCADYGRRYGGITLVWRFNRPAVMLNDPELIGAGLDTQPGDFYKDAPVRALKPVITPASLFITNFGRGWEQARRENPFSAVDYDEWLARQVEPLRAVVTEMVKGWVAPPEGKPVDPSEGQSRLRWDLPANDRGFGRNVRFCCFTARHSPSALAGLRSSVKLLVRVRHLC